MSNKQNIVFFLGITLLIMVFWVNGYWSILTSAFSASGPPSIYDKQGHLKFKNGKPPPPTNIKAI